MTPSFNYIPPQYSRNPYGSHMTTPIHQEHTNQFVVNAYSADMDAVESGHFAEFQQPEFQQYGGGVGLMAEGGNGNGAYYTEDGRQVVVREVEPEPMGAVYNQHGTLDRYVWLGIYMKVWRFIVNK